VRRSSQDKGDWRLCQEHGWIHVQLAQAPVGRAAQPRSLQGLIDYKPSAPERPSRLLSPRDSGLQLPIGTARLRSRGVAAPKDRAARLAECVQACHLARRAALARAKIAKARGIIRPSVVL
jgi:hypothetical protein